MRRRSLGLGVALWLLAGALLPAPSDATDGMFVRVTFYRDYGVTYYGETTGYGTAACGWAWDEWQELYLPAEDRTVWCSDRGGGLSDWQVDVFDPNGWQTIVPYGDVQEVVPIFRY